PAIDVGGEPAGALAVIVGMLLPARAANPAGKMPKNNRMMADAYTTRNVGARTGRSAGASAERGRMNIAITTARYYPADKTLVSTSTTASDVSGRAALRA